MQSLDKLERENEAFRNRISALSAAALRVSTSLDVNTVLNEIVESGCTLTGADYAAIMAVDKAGQIQEFAFSGTTEADLMQLLAWEDATRFFNHLLQLPKPVRVPDLSDHIRQLGYATNPIPSKTLLGIELRHRNEHIGVFFLSSKAGAPAFTQADEEMLVLFGSQAAAAVANARKHRDEQRARADLETLVDTSPIGVAVFDAHSGLPVSFNQEVRRILDIVREPGYDDEQLMKSLTWQRASGQEVRGSSLVQELRNPETLRTEEMVLSGPNGRRVTILVNATPIRSASGEVESLVATVQDLEPLEEIERSRAEFLGMVSHELRAPLTSIKGSTATVLGDPSTLAPAEMLQFFRIIDEQADHMRVLISDLLDAGRMATGTLSVAPEPVDVAGLVEQARNTFLSGGGRHTLHIDLATDLPPVMADSQRIVQVLNNLVANAARHSPEASPIRVSAAREGVHVAVSVSDKGRGVPADRLPHLFQKYAGDDQDRSGGYGLGLAICKGLVEAHGGRIRAESGGAGQGTRFTFTLPAVEAAGAGAPGSLDPVRPDSPQPGQEKYRILVLDDDPQTLRYVRDTLSKAGYLPLVTGDPRELPRLVTNERPQLVLLDLALPGTDGIALMEQVPELAEVPVIFISGYGRDETIARAFEVGAADYIVKPFSPTELTARVRAALRKQARPETFRLGELAIHYHQRRVTVADRPVRLTATEYGLLRLLSVNAGQVVTYDAILDKVWGGKESADLTVLRAFVKKLRRKLGDNATRPTCIFTEHGVGYRLGAPDDPPGYAESG